MNIEHVDLEDLTRKYRLSEEDHRIIFEKLKKEIFSTQTPSDHPSVMFVIGQPGCGKTTFIQNANLAGYVIINSDDYRKLSIYSSEILRDYPSYYAKLTNHDAHLWGDELFAYGIKNGFSVLREKAPVNYELLETIKELSGRCDLNIYLVATGNLTSLLATRERYEKEVIKSSRAKLSSIEAHNKCYALLPDFISKCIQFGAKVSYVVPEKNEYRIISVRDNSIYLLEQIRQTSNQKASENFVARIKNIKEAMRKRNAPQEQFEEIAKIEILHGEFIKGKNSKDSEKEKI